MPFIVNDLGKYVDDKYKNRTMINEMKAFYNFEDRIRRIHITKRKAVNVPTHVPTNTHEKFDITIIIQLYKLYDFYECTIRKTITNFSVGYNY